MLAKRTPTVARAGRACVLVAMVAVAGLGLTGCAAAAKSLLNHATHGLIGGNAALNNFTSKVQTGDNTTYDVTYETTGSSPSTVQYAAQPPHDFAFIGTQSGQDGNFTILQNSSGEYECSQSSAPSTSSTTGTGSTGKGTTGSGTTGTGTTGTTTTTDPSSGGSKWTCLDIGAANSTDYQDLFQFYTGAYWIDILKVYSGVAGLEGVKITSKSMTVNGFKLSCIVISGGSGTEAGNTGTYCVTSQGILGYVASSGSSSNFEIKSYSTSPPASLFQLPAGASITTLPTTSSST